jgi:hypothetical protein
MTFPRWTDKDFDELSWHDNTVHALRIVEDDRDSGTAQLILDIDHILKWCPGENGTYSFIVAPATLTFHGVFGLKFFLDYEKATAGTTPFTIDGIVRRIENRKRYEAVLWTIPINWPTGEISFEATGFTQELRAEPGLSKTMSLEGRALPWSV